MQNKFTLQHLQQATLTCQGLGQPAAFGTGKKAVLHALEHMGYIQIDALSVVERAHHHTLWTRIPTYKPLYLEQLVNERKVFEYWFHAASYLPMKDYRFALPLMQKVKQNKAYAYKADPKTMQHVLAVIRAEGPKKASDFENKKKKAGSWWNWKPTKLALEKLFMQGDLMVSGRNGMFKLYDVCERVLPTTVNTTEPTPTEFAEYLVNTHLNAYGCTTRKQITHLRNDELLKKNVTEILHTLVQKGFIQQLRFPGLPPTFVQTRLLEKTERKFTPNIRLLSPFDNAIIHRDRIKHLFGFDFRLECYLPKEKREYGYFCLPILFGNVFMGRVDCKTHRKNNVLELIYLHIENTAITIDMWLPHFVDAVKAFAVFNSCNAITLTQVSPVKLKSTVKQALRNYMPA